MQQRNNMKTYEQTAYSELTKTVYGINEIEKILGVKRTKIWRIQKAGFLRKLPVGRGNRVPRAELIRYLQSAASES